MKNQSFIEAGSDREKLQRTILHALRHDPWKYGLDPDDEGWLALEDLLTALRQDRPFWRSLERRHLETLLIAGQDRFEVFEGRVRARYGYSITLAKAPDPSVPPDSLFHGTELDALDDILQQGLQPLARGFVHLTSSPAYALLVSASKPTSLVLLVKARHAHERGALFRRATEHVWLAETVAPEFIEVARLVDFDLLERPLPDKN